MLVRLVSRVICEFSDKSGMVVLDRLPSCAVFSVDQVTTGIQARANYLRVETLRMRIQPQFLVKPELVQKRKVSNR